MLEMQGYRRHRVEEAAIVADQDQGAAVIAQKPLEPQRGFEVEMIGRLVEQQAGRARRRGSRRARRASASRPTDRAKRPALHRLVEAEPGQDARGPARRRMGVDLDEPGLDLGGAQRLRPGLPLGEQAGALTVGGEHRFERRRRPRPAPPAPEIRSDSPRGSSIDPPSGCKAPRIRSSKVDLPAPLRPTSPTLLPSAICALAWSSKIRPPMRYVTPESVSIAVS